MKQFFARLEAHHLSHPFDGNGQRVGRIPKYLTELVDDPYRSLAGLARKAGAFDKVDVKGICKEHLAQTIHRAIVLANESAAARLPGFHGGKSMAELPTQSEIADRLIKRHGADDVAPGLPVVSTKSMHPDDAIPATSK